MNSINTKTGKVLKKIDDLHSFSSNAFLKPSQTYSDNDDDDMNLMSFYLLSSSFMSDRVGRN